VRVWERRSHPENRVAVGVPDIGGTLAAGHGRWDRFVPKLLHLIAKPEELSGQRASALSGGWELEWDIRKGSVARFAVSTDPRAVCAGCVTGWVAVAVAAAVKQ
jgi:hypothetical protein